VGNIEAGKIHAEREVGDKIHPMLLAFMQSCVHDRQQRIESNVHGFLWQISENSGWKNNSN